MMADVEVAAGSKDIWVPETEVQKAMYLIYGVLNENKIGKPVMAAALVILVQQLEFEGIRVMISHVPPAPGTH